MRYLSLNEIVEFNRQTILRNGGNFVPPSNLLNEERLYYLVEIVQNDLYYPSIYHKAGLYLFNIVANHIFQDGNKRTGFLSMLLFLKLNGYQIQNLEEDFIYDLVIKVASSQLTFDDCVEWVEKHTTKA